MLKLNQLNNTNYVFKNLGRYTSNKVGDKKPSLKTKAFKVVDQKLIKAAIIGGSGLIKDFEVNMASDMPKYSHLSFKSIYILSTQVNQSDFGMGQGSNLNSSLQGPQMEFLCWYKGWTFSKYGKMSTKFCGQWSINMGPKTYGSFDPKPNEFCPEY